VWCMCVSLCSLRLFECHRFFCLFVLQSAMIDFLTVAGVIVTCLFS
jgi:hypothetical protein